MTLRTTSHFAKDLKRVKRRGKDLNKLWAVLETLMAGDERHSRHRPHRLSGQWSEFCECHIEPDWLLIWDRQQDALVLVRTGTHSDPFG